MTLLAQRRDRELLERLSDEEVVARVRAGESGLFELIMRRYNRRLFRIARAVLADDAEAEDAVQDAYVGAYFKLHQFRGPGGFATWLCRIATNEALMRRRGRSRSALSRSSALDEPANHESVIADLQSPDHNPEAALHEHELRGLLENAIDALPEVYRAAFVMREVERMSVAETAHCLSIEEATVKTRVHRARRMLQRDLTSDLATALTGAFDFDGSRCDRLVARVFACINRAAGTS